MSATGWGKELETAIEAVRQASLVCRRVQSEIAGASIQKDDKSPVTVADFASQAIICRVLGTQFPKDPIVGEESAADLLDDKHRVFLDRVVELLRGVDATATKEAVCAWIDAGRGSSASRFWTLDPIDGTKGFLRGEQYAVSLALIVDGQIRVSVLGCPNLLGRSSDQHRPGVVFSAVRDQGASVRSIDDDALEPQPVLTSATSESAKARFCESVESGHSAHGRSARIAEVLGIKNEPIRLDSQAKYGVVARGEADVYLRLPTKAGYQEKIWDHAGGVLVVEEAGGKVTDIDGKPLEFTHGRELTANRGIIATNGLIHDAVLEAVKKTA
jgi:3'(2'), 5'-bisphosphate nucleotidase